MLVEVDTTDWRPALIAAHRDGYVYLDLLTVIDRSDLSADASGPWEFIAHLLDPAQRDRMWIRCHRDAPQIESVVDVFTAAAWHQREITDMFGIAFTGAPGSVHEPLFCVRTQEQMAHGSYPLRKTTPLTARITTPWPGHHEPGGGRPRSRRAARPPGVPQAWLDRSTQPEQPDE